MIHKYIRPDTEHCTAIANAILKNTQKTLGMRLTAHYIVNIVPIVSFVTSFEFLKLFRNLFYVLSGFYLISFKSKTDNCVVCRMKAERLILGYWLMPLL